MSQKEIQTFLQSEIFKKSKKLKGKFASFSEIIDNEYRVLKIKTVYDLSEKSKNLYLFVVKNYSNPPKERFYLAMILAAQSSDLLVSLAKDFAQKNDLKLVQYAIHPKRLRVSLISLKEIETLDDFSLSVDILKEFRTSFRKMLEKIKSSIESS